MKAVRWFLITLDNFEISSFLSKNQDFLLRQCHTVWALLHLSMPSRTNELIDKIYCLFNKEQYKSQRMAEVLSVKWKLY